MGKDQGGEKGLRAGRRDDAWAWLRVSEYKEGDNLSKWYLGRRSKGRWEHSSGTKPEGGRDGRGIVHIGFLCCGYLLGLFSMVVMFKSD